MRVLPCACPRRGGGGVTTILWPIALLDARGRYVCSPHLLTCDLSAAQDVGADRGVLSGGVVVYFWPKGNHAVMEPGSMMVGAVMTAADSGCSRTGLWLTACPCARAAAPPGTDRNSCVPPCAGRRAGGGIPHFDNCVFDRANCFGLVGPFSTADHCCATRTVLQSRAFPICQSYQLVSTHGPLEKFIHSSC